MHRENLLVWKVPVDLSDRSWGTDLRKLLIQAVSVWGLGVLLILERSYPCPFSIYYDSDRNSRPLTEPTSHPWVWLFTFLKDSFRCFSKRFANSPEALLYLFWLSFAYEAGALRVHSFSQKNSIMVTQPILLQQRTKIKALCGSFFPSFLFCWIFYLSYSSYLFHVLKSILSFLLPYFLPRFFRSAKRKGQNYFLPFSSFIYVAFHFHPPALLIF